MANTNAPFGMRPLRNVFGSVPTYQQTAYQIVWNNANTFGTGDIVKLSAGYVDVAGTTDHPVLGVFVGCEYYDPNQNKILFMPQWRAPVLNSTLTPTAYVIDDPNVVFEVQSSGAAVTIANIGSTAKFTGNGAPNALTGVSTLALDAANIGSTTTYPLMILGPSQKIGVDNTSSYNTVEVKLNDQALVANNS